jgi:hypothetical protein
MTATVDTAPAVDSRTPIQRFNDALRSGIVAHKAASGLCDESISKPMRILFDEDSDVEYRTILVPVRGLARFEFRATNDDEAMRLTYADIMSDYDNDGTGDASDSLEIEGPFTWDFTGFPTEVVANTVLLPTDHDDAEVIVRKAAVRAYVEREVRERRTERRHVNPILERLGIEPIAGLNEYVFLLPVTTGIQAKYTARGTSVELAQAELARIIRTEGSHIPANRLVYSMPADVAQTTEPTSVEPVGW